jgi:hypothetical protein
MTRRTAERWVTWRVLGFGLWRWQAGAIGVAVEIADAGS